MLYFLFIVLHLFLQNVQVFKFNFSNYNFALLFYSVIFLSKRLLFKVWADEKTRNPVHMNYKQVSSCE